MDFPHPAGGRGEEIMTWIQLATSRRARRRSGRIALVVGTVVSLINQGGPIASGRAGMGTWLRVAANYVVPLAVSSFAYVSAARALAPGGSAER